MGAGWGAVVLAGGRARRLGGVDKAALVIDGRSLLDTVLLACVEAGAGRIVVVGPRRAAEVDVVWAFEQPPHGGPVAGLAAGLAAGPAAGLAAELAAGPAAGPAEGVADRDGPDVTAVLAADLPRLRASTLRRLLDALAADQGADGALLVDRAGRPQWLTGVWRVAALRAALADLGDPVGQPLRALLGNLSKIELPALGDEAADVDTQADLEVHSRHTGCRET